MLQRCTATGDARWSVANLPTNILCHLVQLAREQRIDPAAWFRGLRLEPEEINDPHTRVSYRQAFEFIARAQRALGMPDLGLVVGRRQNLGNFGLLGLAMKTASGFSEAIALGMTFQRTTGALLDLDIDAGRNGEIAMRAHLPVPAPDLLPFLCEEMFASCLMVARDLAGSCFAPLRVELAYPAPAYADEYTASFGCEVRFDQPRNALVVDGALMSLTFPTYNPVTACQVRELCRRQLMLDMQEQGEAAATVERYLRRHLAENPTLSEVASSMHLSERTLRRHLAADGATFSGLHDGIRTECAMELLRDPRLSIAHVGSRIGFNDAREFRRAFKRWTGQTPSEVRADADPA